jgi:uncharacterized membrane protein YidH (DUF202 family)
MRDRQFRNEVTAALDTIQSLLDRSVSFQEEIRNIESDLHELEKEDKQTSLGLLQCAGTENTLAMQRTGMAQERTGLVREQTRLSTKSTELAAIRTDLARDRTSLAGRRTDLAMLRSNLSQARTNLAVQRTHMAGSRTTYSKVRTELARGRTHLALVRTGLAFLSLSVGFFRFFGLSWWSVFDGLIALGSLAVTGVGMLGYWRANQIINIVEGKGS